MRIALAGAAMFAVSFALRVIILSLVLGTLAYGIAAVLVRAVPTGDVAHIVKSLWGQLGVKAAVSCVSLESGQVFVISFKK